METVTLEGVRVKTIIGDEPDMIECPVCGEDLKVVDCQGFRPCFLDTDLIISYECECGFKGSRRIKN